MERFKSIFSKRKILIMSAVSFATSIVFLVPSLAFAQDAGPSAESIAIDTVWVMLAAFLVFFMQAGFFTLEVGFTRAKNAGHIAWKILVNLSLSALVFWTVGFAIAFGTGSGLAGSSGWFLNVAPDDTNTALA